MPKKFYILSQSYKPDSGSFSGFFEILTKELHNKGYEVIMLCQKSKKNEKKEETFEYFKVYRFPHVHFKIFSTFVNTLLFSFYSSKFFKKNSINKEDVIFANGYTPFGILNKKYILRTPDQPVFTFIKNMNIAKNEVSFLTRIARIIDVIPSYIFDSLTVKKAKALVISSLANREENIKNYKVSKKSYFCPNKCLDKKYFLIERKKSKDKNLLFVCSKTERIRKGAYLLERVLPEIFEKYKNVKLIHLGDKFEWNVPEKYKDRIISNKVPWSEMIKYYSESDMFVSCSLSEGIHYVFIEAMASGLPIVTSDIDGINEYITDGKEGFIFKRGDAEGLKNAIIKTLENKNIKKMKKLARAKVSTLVTDNFIDTFLEFIDKSYCKNENFNVDLINNKLKYNP